MTIKQHAEKNGSRQTARAIVDKQIKSVIFLGLDDLPDTFELCEIVDEIETIIENIMKAQDEQEIKELKQGIIESIAKIDENFIREQL